MAMKPFRHVEMFRPNRSVFDLSHYKLLDCDMGQLIPVLCEKMVPGDHFKISNEVVVRVQPMVAPIMHEINLFVHYFFVPLRILWPKPRLNDIDPVEDGSWEDFFTGGRDGLLEPVKPKWNPTLPQTASYTLWDYFGHPIDVVPTGTLPDIWPLRGLNFVWNEYYRDQNYMDEVDLDDPNLKYRCWEKDYFTTALPWTQRGQAPALPITGLTNAEFLGNVTVYNSPGLGVNSGALFTTGPILNNYFSETPSADHIKSWFNNNRVDLSNASTFDVNDLRLAFQTQKFLERNARAGARYIEQLRAHYGVNPRDDRLQRPEYIGGTRQPIIVSEVLQTSSTDGTSPQGNLAGHGLSVNRSYACSYYAQEFGIVLGLMSIMPRPVYQQGIDRQWLGDTRYDELLPEFVNLGEQPIYRSELYATGVQSENETVFGFQGRYDEYRSRRSIVTGKMRTTAPTNFGFWHLAREFGSPPVLNQSFLECKPRKDFLAVPSETGFIVTFGNIIRAVRPLPVVGTPGLIDHH